VNVLYHFAQSFFIKLFLWQKAKTLIPPVSEIQFRTFIFPLPKHLKTPDFFLRPSQPQGKTIFSLRSLRLRGKLFLKKFAGDTPVTNS
jgi:hypothetical protein